MALRAALRMRSQVTSGTPMWVLVRGASTVSPDVIIVGAGHNGLVAATLLGRQGLQVEVYEEKQMVGGACKTEFPFKNAPALAQNTGAYLLGVMPPELLQNLGLKVTLLRRDPHYFLPTTSKAGGRYLLFGSDQDSTRRQFLSMFSQEDWDAHQALQREIGQLRDDVGPSWLQPPLSVEDTAAQYVRPALREIYVALCRGTVKDYLDRFGFKSNLVKAMYAVTDGLSGLHGSWKTPGSGFNFLAHNMCRLPGSDGTWMVVQGGMGQVTQQIAQAAKNAGVKIFTDSRVEQVVVENGVVQGIVLKNSHQELRRARAVVINADPFRLRDLVGGPEALPASLNQQLEFSRRQGTTLKVNLALRGLPRYSCLPEDLGQHRTTTHLLPDDEDQIVAALDRAFDDATKKAALPDFPTMEVYTQTSVDSNLSDDSGRHSAALFVQWVPYQPAGSSWDEERDGYVDHLLGIWERFAPGVKSLVDDVFALAPPDIERHFGISYGHIHHIDNTFAGVERFPHRVPGLQGLFSCSAGTHPAGSVIGAAGHNAAMEVMKVLCAGAEAQGGYPLK